MVVAIRLASRSSAIHRRVRRRNVQHTRRKRVELEGMALIVLPIFDVETNPIHTVIVPENQH